MPTIECFIPNATLPPANVCIYCGRSGKDQKLTTEHVIPKSLKGYIKLPLSSCKECADITKRFEGVCARRMLGEFRIHTGMGWGRKSDQPNSLGGVFVKSKKGRYDHTELSIDSHPFIFVMPIFCHPRGPHADKNEISTRSMKFWIRDVQGNTASRLEKIGKPMQLRNLIPITAFVRMLAKIAHAYAAGCIGVNNFSPFVIDVINGRDYSNWPRWIGGCEYSVPFLDFVENKPVPFHKIWIEIATNKYTKEYPDLLIVKIQLFSFLGAPVYQFIVGSVTGKIAL